MSKTLEIVAKSLQKHSGRYLFETLQKRTVIVESQYFYVISRRLQPDPEKLLLEGDTLLVDRVICEKSEPGFMPFCVVNFSKFENLTVSASHNQLVYHHNHARIRSLFLHPF